MRCRGDKSSISLIAFWSERKRKDNWNSMDWDILCRSINIGKYHNEVRAMLCGCKAGVV